MNIKGSNIANLLSIFKPTGKGLQLEAGEIVRADVMDIFSSGKVSLKIKGSFLVAKTGLTLQKDSSVLLKVLAASRPYNEIKLKFIGYAETSEGIATDLNFLKTEGGKALSGLIKELTAGLKEYTEKNYMPGRSSSPPGRGPDIKVIESIIKALPQDMNLIPAGVRSQLLGLLKTFLRMPDSSIPLRVSTLMSRCLQGPVEKISPDAASEVLFAAPEALEGNMLQEALRNTGTLLEAKLRVPAVQLLRAEDAATDHEIHSAPDNTEPGSAEKKIAGEIKASIMKQYEPIVEKDLKSKLLRIRRRITDDLEQPAKLLPEYQVKEYAEDIRRIDLLLKEIETFQLVAKITDALYCFLPVLWDTVKKGDILFKRIRRDIPGSSFFCRINLDLGRLGELTIYLLIQGSDFNVAFKASDTHFDTILNSNADRLQKQFSSKGLNLRSVRVMKPGDDSFEALENLGDNSFNDINLRV